MAALAEAPRAGEAVRDDPRAASIEARVYRSGGETVLSVADLLRYFSEHGSLRVSDLHLKAGCPPVYRVDGALQRLQSADLDAATVEALARNLLTPEEWPRLEAKRSLDGSLITDRMQFRYNAFFENDGLAIAVRALEPTPMQVQSVGFPNGAWQDIVARQWGLVLVTGITGAGKSTTISALINHIAETRACRIITLEDPIEYRLSSRAALVSQREVGRDVEDFAHGLRDCLREDPDVIFVGEMRDRESAAWTLTAAETGHLVFSTLHTRDARGTVTRIMDMFPANQQDEVASQLSLGLSHIVCQKLIPRADGRGRVAAMEILNNNYATSNIIRTRKLEQIFTVLQTRTKDAPDERMTTLERSLVNLVRSGVIAASEAEQWANQPQVLRDELQRLDG